LRSVVSVAARVISGSPAPLLVIALLCEIPSVLLSVGWVWLGSFEGAGLGWVVQEVSSLVASLITYVAQAAMMVVTVNHLAGGSVTTGVALGKAFSRLWAVIGTALLFLVPTIIVTALLTMAILEVAFAAFELPSLWIVQPMIRFSTIIVWAIVGSIMFVAVSATVMERTGPFASIARSISLTRGHRVGLFALLLVAKLTVGLSMLGMSFLSDGFSEAVGAPSTAAAVLRFLVGHALLLFETVILAVLGGVVYARLREAHDRVDARSLASVFE